MSQFKTKQFNSLKSKWYKKLANDGFEDIEQDDEAERLKLWTSHFFKVRYNESTFQSKEEYYRLAGQFLHEYPFENNRDRLVWELHSDGVSVRQIVVTMKWRGFETYRRQVHETIQRLTKEMINKCR